jgi:hypothetical protein
MAADFRKLIMKTIILFNLIALSVAIVWAVYIILAIDKITKDDES